MPKKKSKRQNQKKQEKQQVKITQHEKNIIKLVLKIQRRWSGDDVDELTSAYSNIINNIANKISYNYRVSFNEAREETYSQFLQLISNYKFRFEDKKKNISYFSNYLKQKLYRLTNFSFRKIASKRFVDLRSHSVSSDTDLGDYYNVVERSLGKRYVEIFKLKVQGYTQDEIAHKLNIVQTRISIFVTRIKQVLNEWLEGIEK